MFSIFSQKPELGCYLQSLPEQQLENLQKNYNDQLIKDVFKKVDLASSFNYFAPQEGWWIIKKWTVIVNLVLYTLNSEKFFDERKTVIVAQIQSRVNSVWEAHECCAKIRKLRGEIASKTEALGALREQMASVATQLSAIPPFEDREEQFGLDHELFMANKDVSWAEEDWGEAEKNCRQAIIDWRSAYAKYKVDKERYESRVKETEGEVAELLSQQQEMSTDSVRRDKLDRTLETAKLRLEHNQIDCTILEEDFEKIQTKWEKIRDASSLRNINAIHTYIRMLTRQELVVKKVDLFKQIGSEELTLQGCEKRLQDLEMSYRK